MAWIAGHSGSVTFAGVAMTATGWMVDWHTDVVDVSSFKGFGWGGYLAGVPDYDVRVDCIYDTTEDPFGPVIQLLPGSSIAAVLYQDSTIAGARYSFSEIQVIEVSMEDAVRDTVRYSVVGKASAYYSTVSILTPSL
jgi:hypothetical protein